MEKESRSIDTLFGLYQRIEGFFLSLSEGVVFLDPEGVVVVLNPTAEKMLGWKQEEAKNLLISQILTPRDGRSKRVQVQQLLSPNPYRFTLTNQRGKLYTLVSKNLPVEGGSLLLLEDVTEKEKKKKQSEELISFITH